MSSSSPIRLQVSDLTVHFGALTALDHVSLDLVGPARVGLIGPNGAGKTTLLNAISGFVPCSFGTVRLGGADLTSLPIPKRVGHGVVRSFQTPRLLDDETVLTNVQLGCHSEPGPGALRQFLLTRGSRRWEAQATRRAWEVIDMVGLAEEALRPCSALSSATRRLVEVARVLAPQPKVLLLDEPAAGLDSRERHQLADLLVAVHEQLQNLLVLVEHDVAIVRRVCDTAVVLAQGSVLAEGTTSAVLDEPDVQEAYFGSAHAAG